MMGLWWHVTEIESSVALWRYHSIYRVFVKSQSKMSKCSVSLHLFLTSLFFMSGIWNQVLSQIQQVKAYKCQCVAPSIRLIQCWPCFSWACQCVELLIHFFAVASGAYVVYNVYKKIYLKIYLNLWSEERTCPTTVIAVLLTPSYCVLVHFVLLQFYIPCWLFESQFYLYKLISFQCLFQENGLHSFYTVWMQVSPFLLYANYIKHSCMKSCNLC